MLLLAGSALLLAPLLAVQLSAGAGRAHACLCEPATHAELFGWADAVFSGQVISGARFLGTVVIRVDTVWKGTVTSTTSVNPDDGTSCSYGGFVNDEDYLVYAYVSPDDGTLTTWACSGTAPLESAQRALQILGEGRALEPGVTPTESGSSDGESSPASGTPRPAPTSSDAERAPAPPATGSGRAIEDGERIAGPGTSDAATTRDAPAPPPAWAIALLAALVASATLVRLAVRPRLPE
ncbi:MAG: hypothetical protein F4X25_03895 [Chloroflexi bacterium]|nr:hypothetical protein [Chloroflexota bacterium]